MLRSCHFVPRIPACALVLNELPGDALQELFRVWSNARFWLQIRSLYLSRLDTLIVSEMKTG